MKQSIRIMMNMIGSEVFAAPFDSGAFLALTEAEQAGIEALARQHSVAQLLGDLLGREPSTRDLPVTARLFHDSMTALSQVSQIDRERALICRELDQAGIPYIQLKGARIRPLYPQPWMRLSCDNDILVHEEEAERASALLTEKLGYRFEQKKFHDISMYSRQGQHLELHFSLAENIREVDRVLDRVWDCSTRAGEGMEYLQSGAFFLFHHVSHMAYHFVKGGCGIRPVIDLRLLEQKLDYDRPAFLSMCREAGLEQFYENICRLMEVWFGSADHTAVTRRMEAYILTGGAYGLKSNRIAVERRQLGSGWKYLLRRIFLPFPDMKIKYPVLVKSPWLLPLYHLRRWAEILKPEKARKLRREVETVRSVDDERLSQIRQLLEDSGLNRKTE